MCLAWCGLAVEPPIHRRRADVFQTFIAVRPHRHLPVFIQVCQFIVHGDAQELRVDAIKDPTDFLNRPRVLCCVDGSTRPADGPLDTLAFSRQDRARVLAMASGGFDVLVQYLTAFLFGRLGIPLLQRY
jgi:hypothetical protein